MALFIVALKLLKPTSSINSPVFDEFSLKSASRLLSEDGENVAISGGMP